MLGRSPLHVSFVIFAAVLVLGGTAFAAGCTSEGTDQVEVTGDSKPEAEGDPQAEADPEADPVADVAPGVVETPPPGAPQVKVTLAEWVIAREVNSVKAGETYFLADNVGPNDAHELVIIKTDLAPGQLPVQDGRVPADKVDIVGAIMPFRPWSQASMVLDLEPGNYALICNIRGHYSAGMWADFDVT